MERNYPYLNDNNFLYEIDTLQYAEEYIKITALNWKDEPLEEVQGLVVDGSLNINGDSAMRRTANFNAAFENNSFAQVTDVDNIFSINKKIYLEKGIVNTTNKYTDWPIIWQPLGEYIITNCSTSHDVGNVTVSVQLQDQMCLLNGSCGGAIPASTQFDSYDTLDENGQWIITKPIVAQIIREAVNHFGGIQLSKIIINDVESKIKAVMRWLGDTPVYLIESQDQAILTTTTPAHPTTENTYTYGDDVGYIYMDYIYNKELVAKPGDNVCTILDQIVSYLGGNYEYFFDVWGNFIFQEKKNYINISNTTIEIENLTNEDYKYDMLSGKRAFDFSNLPIFTSFSNNPQFNNIKNDFIVWGVRKNADGINLPIRYHLAIDQKPQTGNIYQVYFYIDPDDGIRKAITPVQYQSKDSFPQQGAAGVYYQDMSNNKIYIWGIKTVGQTSSYDYIEITNYAEFKTIKTTDWRSELYLQGVMAEPLGLKSNYYYTELANEWPQIYDLDVEYDSTNQYWTGDFKEEFKKDPRSLNYFLDFIDSSASISKFSIDNIGRRTLVESKDDYNCVFENEIPDYVLIEKGQPDTNIKRDECLARNQAFIQVDSNVFKGLGLGGIFNSCYNEIKMLLYEKTGYNESITMNGLPIYHLEPNIRIGANDTASNIYGDYMLKSMSIPLRAGNTMSINAIRVTEKL